MATYSYTVTASSGNDHYLWSGHGLVDAPNANLSFQAGDAITITNVSGGHIMRLIPDNYMDPESSGPVDATSGSDGTTFLFFDPMLEGSYTYVCTSHPSMTGSITVSGKYTGQGSIHRYLVEIDSSQNKYLWYNGLEVIDGAVRSVNTEPNFLGDTPIINIPVGDTLQIFEYRSVASFSQLELSMAPTIQNIKRAYRVMLNREFDVRGLNHYYGNSSEFPTLFNVVMSMGGSSEYLNNQSRLYYHLMRISLLSGVDVARMDDWEYYVRSREGLLDAWDPETDYGIHAPILSDYGKNHAKSEGSYKAYALLSHTFQEIQSITYRPIHGNFDQGENIISVFNRKPLSLASRKVSIENVRAKINDIINSGDQSVSFGDEPQDPSSGDIWFNGSSLMIYLGLDLMTEDGQNSFVTEEDLINLDLERISPWFEVGGNSQYTTSNESENIGGATGGNIYKRWSTDASYRGGAIVLDDQYHGSCWYEQSDIHSIIATDINTGQHLGQIGPPGRGYYMPNPSLTNGGDWGVSGSSTSYPFNDLHAAWITPEIFNVTNSNGTHKDLSSSVDVLWIGGNGGNNYGYLQTFNRATKASAWQTLGEIGGNDVFDLVATIPTDNAWPDLILAEYYTYGGTDGYTNGIKLKKLTFDSQNNRYNGTNSTTTNCYLNLNATSKNSSIALNFRESLGAGNDSFTGTSRTADHTDQVRSFGQIMGLNQWNGHLYVNLMQRANGIAIFKLSDSLTGATWAEKLFNAGGSAAGQDGSMSDITYHGTYAYPAIGYSQGPQTAAKKRIIWDFDNKRANGVSIVNGDVSDDSGWSQKGGFEIVPWQDNWAR